MVSEHENFLKRHIATLDDAKRLIMECAMGVHTARVQFQYSGGVMPCVLTFSDACNGARGRTAPSGRGWTPEFSFEYRWTAVDRALRMIRSEVLNQNITVHWSRENGYIVLFTDTGNNTWIPLPAEQFYGTEFKDFCLRVLELCAAWEGVDEHQKSG